MTKGKGGGRGVDGMVCASGRIYCRKVHSGAMPLPQQLFLLRPTATAEPTPQLLSLPIFELLPRRSTDQNVMSGCVQPSWRMKQSFGNLCLSPRSWRRATSYRSYAVQASGAPAFQVFNRRTKWLQKERAASNPELSREADYLKDEVATRLCERLLVSLALP
jgi:hypothetical protein